MMRKRFALLIALCLMPFAVSEARAQSTQGEPLTAVMDDIDQAVLDAASLEASAGGLPQFDPTWFASQVFWLLVMFGALYVIFARKSLPVLSSIIESRKTRIQSDLELAETLTAEAQAVQSAYEAGLQGARDQSAAMLNDIHASIQTGKNDQAEAFRLKSEAEIGAAEQRLVAAKDKALSEISDIVADIAAQAVEKIIGKPADASQARKIVNNLTTDKQAA